MEIWAFMDPKSKSNPLNIKELTLGKDFKFGKKGTGITSAFEIILVPILLLFLNYLNI